MPQRVLKLKVVKRDGTREEYFHNKVVGTIVNAFGAAGRPDIAVAEEIAEAVTFYLHNNDGRRNIDTGQIFSIIETVLADTGYVQEAIALSEYHFQRKLSRSRVEVVRGKAVDLSCAGKFYQDVEERLVCRWDKSRIVDDLVDKNGFPRQTARAVASMVEEKVFNMGLSVVPAGLIGHLVNNDAAAVLKAQKELQAV